MIPAPENTRTRLKKLRFLASSLILFAFGAPADELAKSAMAVIHTHCLDCHNPEKHKGDLRLDTRELLLQGGAEGVVAVSGKHAESKLYTALHPDADPHMPPKKQLSDAEQKTIAQWIDADLPWDAAELARQDKPKSDDRVQEIPEGYAPSLALALHPDEQFMAVASGREIKIYDLKGDKAPLIHRLNEHQDLVRSLAFSPDKQWLVSGGHGLICIWKVEDFSLLKRLEQPHGRVNALQFSGDVLWAADGKQLHHWKAFDAHVAWPAHDDEIYTLYATSNRVLSAGADRLVKVWKRDSRELERTLEGHTDFLSALVVSPDGKTLATGGVDGDLGIWELDTGVQTHTVKNYPAAIAGLTWSKDKRYIFSIDVKGSMHRAEVTSKSPYGRGSCDQAITALVPGKEPGYFFTLSRQGKVLRWEDSAKNAPLCGEKVELAGTEKLSFVYDILPIFNRHGCVTSECHSRQGGQAGFHLSIFSYDQRADYAELVQDGMGRRVDIRRPGQSLILLKPTKAIDHEGGQRFAPDSAEATTIRDWIAQGMPYQRKEEPALSGVEVEPSQRTYKKGAQQTLKVTAIYADDSRRDVTRLATYASNDKEIAGVGDTGRITAKVALGETAVVARFMGEVGISRVLIPPEKTLPPERYDQLPVHNFIDKLAWKRHREFGLLASDACDDATFLRRVSLDIIGRIPTQDEAKAFLAKPDRKALVDRLLEDPQYADYWAIKWADLVRPNPDRAGLKSVLVIDQWLRDCFRKNMPYDQFVRETLTATGSTHAHGPTVIFRDRREPADRTTMFSQIFMGVRLECARCHQHPNEKWSMTDFYQMAAFFRSVKRKGTGVSPPISGSPEYFFFSPGGSVTHPVSGDEMKLIPPDGDELTVDEATDPRIALADWLCAPENPFLARAIVNRVWAEFFGQGFVNPVDDFRASNPASDPDLLNALAADFIEHGYNLKQLMRRITASALYQRSGEPHEHNLEDTRYFSRAPRRRVSAEVLADMIADVTGVPHTFDSLPPGSRAMQAWNVKFNNDLLDAFGRPDASQDPPCERDRDSTLVQALHVMHSNIIEQKLRHPEGRATRLAKVESLEAIAEEAYLVCYARYPKPEELEQVKQLMQLPDRPRQELVEDLLWVLVNTAEFQFNH